MRAGWGRDVRRVQHWMGIEHHQMCRYVCSLCSLHIKLDTTCFGRGVHLQLYFAQRASVLTLDPNFESKSEKPNQ